jgi:hypothetical protein
MPSGAFTDLDGDRCYVIRSVDRMAPFFVSLVSSDDHWLFVSSTGGLTAGRGSPDTALFPYVTVDKIHESTPHTGPKTMLRVDRADRGGKRHHWEPFNREHDGRYAVTRNLYKGLLGDWICFEETNHDLGVTFRYRWETSASFGFVRRCELCNDTTSPVAVELLDGLQNVLPAGTPRFTQTNSSNLVDAYKWTELDQATGLALFTLYSGITDRAAPCESLRANVVYSLGLDAPVHLVSSQQLDRFRAGESVVAEGRKRGIRGAFFVNAAFALPGGKKHGWRLVSDVELSQSDVVSLRQRLRDPTALALSVSQSVSNGAEALARIMAGCDGFQATAQETVSAHHCANVTFNVLRGGYFPEQYAIPVRDFAATVKAFNRPVYERHRAWLEDLAAAVDLAALEQSVAERDDPQLARLFQEYLPISFGRRHGDPSRPWNQFSIRVHDRRGDPLFWYEGNWRDVFQNWEALVFSYPEFIEHTIAKFVNASTMEGYNPYRITKDGIDWEVEDPEDPWSYIGYWGDHQIIYLLKLLELSHRFHPARLGQLLHRPIFSYAHVPYRIRPFAALLADPKTTVDYDEALAADIEARVAHIGADGKLVPAATGEVCQVTLAEKLLVPLLAKLGNLVADGGIWLNTQRPEWNDANNALVGYGLSMVTLYYLRRYVTFLKDLLAGITEEFSVSSEVGHWLAETAAVLRGFRPRMATGALTAAGRFELLEALGEAAGRYRSTVYGQRGFTGLQALPASAVRELLDDALAVIDHSIGRNRGEDGLFHAYNLLTRGDRQLEVEPLYPMLEGQVAALSAGAVSPETAADVVEALFRSPVYREDQQTFMLYPDRELPGFLEKNQVPAEAVEGMPLLTRLLARKDHRIVERDAEGVYRFNADFTNVDDLNAMLDVLREEYGSEVEGARAALGALFEKVFHHQAFTGRSGTMFGFEGLGCVYWHMVSKLLLAVQENFFAALDAGADEAVLHRLGDLYYRVRAGLGFNKRPAEYGAFPTDPYSHTPGHGGASQPGMTGQVKEELLARFGELGVRVIDGGVRFQPHLLRAEEFLRGPAGFRYLDVDGSWQSVDVPAGGLAFTWCQVPIVYTLSDDLAACAVTCSDADGSRRTVQGIVLPGSDSRSLFRRDGRLRRIDVTVHRQALFANRSPG